VIQISRREKLTIGVGVIALFGFLIIEWVVFPIYDRQQSVAGSLSRQQATLLEVNELAREITEIRTVMATSQQRLATKKQGFSLFSFLDDLASQSGLKDRIVYMKPSVSKIKNTDMALSIVEMKLEAIELGQLVQFLHKIETSSEDVSIRRMSLLTAGKDRQSLNAVLEIATISV
jgi:general secretion pathway protein M